MRPLSPGAHHLTSAPSVAFVRRAALLLPLVFACGTSGGVVGDGGSEPDATARDGAVRDTGARHDAGRGDASPSDARPTDAASTDAGALARHEVLFLGNSYTFGNDLPALYRELVARLAPPPDPLRVDSVTAGGYRLVQHAADAANPNHRLAGLLAADGPEWTQVILQEQSQIPGFAEGQADFEASRQAAADLGGRIGPRGAEVVLFMTWGRREGDARNMARFPDFTTMQAHLEAGYRRLAEAARGAGATASIAPVGLAFAQIHAEDAVAGDPLAPEALFWRLYASDGSHPGPLGSYLAACVIAATTLGVDATTIGWAPPGIDAADAARLRAAAQRAVEAERG